MNLDKYPILGYIVAIKPRPPMEVREQIALFGTEKGKSDRSENVEAIDGVSIKTKQRRFGAYYTPRSAADLMADWVVRSNDEVVLEPSFGDGVFIRAIDRSVESRGFEGISLLGVELDDSADLKLNGVSGKLRLKTIRSDFLETTPSSVDGVIGNPPYVRLRHLNSDQKVKALQIAQQSLGHKMESSGSVWMPFVLHAIEYLRSNGRLAMVLPYEFTYVKYAFPLWKKLAGSFKSLEVQRSKERLFPDVMQEVVILYADGYGGTTDTVDFRAFDTVSDLVQDTASVEQTVSIHNIISGERVFVKALLSDELTILLNQLLPAHTLRMEDMAKVRIGYVAGDKDFFHPDNDTVTRYSIRRKNLVESITSTKSLSKSGVNSGSIPSESISTLFLPQVGLSDSEVAYIRYGESIGVQERYKCRIRSPWYVVPGVKTPDLIMSVFSERPLVMLNDVGYSASNSLICGYIRLGFSAEDVVTAWYTSLTLLQCEMEIHSLGGGVMVLIPGEANKIRLPSPVRTDEQHLQKVDACLKASKTDEAYLTGDTFVLQNQLEMGPSEIDLIKEGVETLKKWRTAHRG